MAEWVSVCKTSDLVPGTGLCVLYEGEQVAIFCENNSNSLYAVSNYDPIGEANVMSRGILGSIGEEIVVASPLYKQRFSLTTGVCLDRPDKKLKTYRVEREGEDIMVHSAD